MRKILITTPDSVGPDLAEEIIAHVEDWLDSDHRVALITRCTAVVVE